MDPAVTDNSNKMACESLASCSGDGQGNSVKSVNRSTVVPW